jgi:hypothetical protein
VNLRLGTGLESALEQVAAADDGDVAGGPRAAVTAAGRGDTGEDRRAAGDQLPPALGLEFLVGDDLLVAELAPLLVGAVHLLGKIA